MSKTNTFETNLLNLIFCNTSITGIGDAAGLRGDDTEGPLYVALYTTAPTDTTLGVEVTTAEYTGYTRVQMDTVDVVWTVSGNTASNFIAVTFPQCTGGTGCTVVAVGILATDETLIYWADLDSSLNISTGIQPEFPIGDLEITED